jgi:hypothetical protein
MKQGTSEWARREESSASLPPIIIIHCAAALNAMQLTEPQP